MPGATRVGLDTAGGLITGALQTFVTLDGYPWALLGAAVASHGDSPHDSATMAEGSAFVTIDGVPVVLAGHAATCGHLATGSSTVSASG